MYNILIADDEYLEREVLKNIIRKMDGTNIVGDTNSGRTAVSMCRALRPDLIFLNRLMGGINGIDATRQIRRNDPDIVIIMTTAYDQYPIHHELGNLKINDYLLKPIRPAKIEEVIQNYIDQTKPAKPPAYRNRKELPFYPAQIMSKEITASLLYIDNNYKKNLSLEDVSKVIYLSSYYFSRLFKKEVGVNFSGYLLHKKLDEAKRMLETTDASVLEISTALGFAEQSYFCKVFKKHIGQSPTQYRSYMKLTQQERMSVRINYYSN